MSRIVVNREKSKLILHEVEPNITELLAECVKAVENELEVHPAIFLYGKQVHQRRSVGFYSDQSAGYTYSKVKRTSMPLHHQCLRDLLRYICDRFNVEYNGILINRYENGEEYICKHSDSEPGLGEKVSVIAMSYGASRKFRIRDKLTNKIVVDLPTNNHQIIEMAGDFQQEFTHEVPIEKTVKECRYSFTFRRHIL